MIDAIVLSPSPVELKLPAGVNLINHCEVFSTTEGIHMARRRALEKSTAPWCFFLDSDDELPPDVESVLDDCMNTQFDLAYTDELVIEKDRTWRRSSMEYESEKHARSPLLVHHLALMRTDAAIKALDEIPAGELWIEHLLYFQLGKTGAKYVPRIGYHWKKGDGMHRARGILAAQVRAAAWCMKQL